MNYFNYSHQLMQHHFFKEVRKCFFRNGAILQNVHRLNLEKKKTWIMHDRCNAMQNFLALVMKDIVTQKILVWLKKEFQLIKIPQQQQLRSNAFSGMFISQQGGNGMSNTHCDLTLQGTLGLSSLWSCHFPHPRRNQNLR